MCRSITGKSSRPDNTAKTKTRRNTKYLYTRLTQYIKRFPFLLLYPYFPTYNTFDQGLWISCMVFLSLVSFFVFITNKRQPRFSIHAHAHTRHSPYKKFRVGKYKWSSTVSLLFHFSFFFFFVLFLILNSFSQTFGFEKTVAPLYF